MISMEYYSQLEVMVISAHDLDDTDTPLDFSSSCPPPSWEVYAVLYVMIGGDVHAMQKTPPDRTGGNNPRWHYAASFFVPRDGRRRQIDLQFSLLRRSPRGDSGVGVVSVSLEELLLSAAQYYTAGGPRCTEFLVSGRLTTPSGRLRGVLRFAVRYREDVAAAPPRGVGHFSAAECSSDLSPEPVSPETSSAPSQQLGEFGGSPRQRRLSRLRNRIELVAALSTGLLLRRLLSEVFLVRRFMPPSPPPGMLYVYVPTLPPAHDPSPPAVVGFYWPAVLLLAGALVAIPHAYLARGLNRRRTNI